jgi:CubicO group peptidase (beta-lactamase class C family)
MTQLQDLLESTVESGAAPGAAALIARGEEVEIVAVGEVEQDSIVRIASITKPITAAAVMLLVDDGLVSLDDPIARWLPELASPQVVRTPGSAIDDLVPAVRPITVEDLLNFRAGWGLPVGLLASGGRRALREAPGVRDARDAGRMAHDARATADAPPARGRVALQHLL